MDLQTPLRELGIKYKTQGKKLDKLGIITIEDLLFYAPARYDDLSTVTKIDKIQAGTTVTIQGEILQTEQVYTKRHFNIQKIHVSDATGVIECIWFNQPYITQTLKKGVRVSIAGRVEESKRIASLLVKDYEILEEGIPTTHTARLVPIYPETHGLTSKWLRNRIREVIASSLNSLEEFLPESIKSNHNLVDIKKAIAQLHFPDNSEHAQIARNRLSFDELLLTQLAALKRRLDWEEATITRPFSITPYEKKITMLINSLPFSLTHGQQKAIDEIFSDLTHTKPMNRLVQGDVGSGKTIVAAISLYLAHLNGFQGAYMAPTSILAQQHYNTISKILEPFKVTVELVLGGSKSKKTSDKAHIIIGTHALLGEKASFTKLGLIVIDEQQRFGVEQRSILRDKGTNPHFLTMTATPIPRTIFLTMYGDLDLSYLAELPRGRQQIKTWYVPTIKREGAYEWIKKQIKESGDQVFIVCPFIEESENMQTVKAATQEYAHLKKDIFPKLKVGLLHGKMKVSEKNEVLSDFKDKKYDILVSTPVVEVGVDVPNATIMLIEGAERFGLAQLHQLRGRVGRGTKQSYCLLFSEQASEQTVNRLKALERIQSGAELAELDLKLRGPGEIFGTHQHGVPFLKIASFSNFPLIEKTREEAQKIVKRLAEFPLLQEKVKSTITQRVSPD